MPGLFEKHWLNAQLVLKDGVWDASIPEIFNFTEILNNFWDKVWRIPRNGTHRLVRNCFWIPYNHDYTLWHPNRQRNGFPEIGHFLKFLIFSHFWTSFLDQPVRIWANRAHRPVEQCQGILKSLGSAHWRQKWAINRLRKIAIFENFWFLAISDQDCGRKRPTRGYNEGIFEHYNAWAFRKT